MCLKANRTEERSQNNKQPDLINQEQMFVAIVKGYGNESNIKNAQYLVISWFLIQFRRKGIHLSLVLSLCPVRTILLALCEKQGIRAQSINVI